MEDFRTYRRPTPATVWPPVHTGWTVIAWSYCKLTVCLVLFAKLAGQKLSATCLCIITRMVTLHVETIVILHAQYRPIPGELWSRTKNYISIWPSLLGKLLPLQLAYTDTDTNVKMICQLSVSANKEVILELIIKKCVPILTYGLEVCALPRRVLQSLDFTINRVLISWSYSKVRI